MKYVNGEEAKLGQMVLSQDAKKRPIVGKVTGLHTEKTHPPGSLSVFLEQHGGPMVLEASSCVPVAAITQLLLTAQKYELALEKMDLLQKRVKELELELEKVQGEPAAS